MEARSRAPRRLTGLAELATLATGAAALFVLVQPAPAASVTVMLHAGGLEAVVDADGVMVFPEGETGWSAGFRTRAFGREGALRPVRRAPPRTESVPGGPTGQVSKGVVQAVQDRGHGLLEWHQALPQGIEQGFTVLARPPGAGSDPLPLVVEEELAGTLEVMRAGAGELALGLPLPAGGAREVVAYGGLKAWDAAGRGLPARFAWSASAPRTTSARTTGASSRCTRRTTRPAPTGPSP